MVTTSGTTPNRTVHHLYDRTMLDARADDGAMVRAAAENQTAWLARMAEAADGVVHRERGFAWTASPAGAVLAFPRMSAERLGALLPVFLQAADATPEASCWSLLPTEPADLGERLARVGFREGWQAQWMAASIVALPARPPPEGVEVGLVERPWPATGLPWDGVGIASVRTRLAEARPRRVWHVGAWSGEVAVGHAVVNVTSRRNGVAGIYDMGVAERERRRGIGAALTCALVEHARELGCAVATLNATPEGEALYRALGFRRVGIAQTWWR
jgi:GNAT superfamily N-acetyltransferase